eukprot:m51a1_g10846 hypothetical protein (1229) ;mRNA; f:34907-39904
MGDSKPLSFAPPEGAKKKEKKKHVHSENEAAAGLTIIGALMGGRSVPTKYLQEAEVDDLVLKKAQKPLRLNPLSYGHPEIHYSELFGIQWGYISNLPLIKSTTIWQLEKGAPLRVQPDDYGVFCQEDVYLVLAPGNGEGANFELFNWVGSKSSSCKRAYGAIRASQLNLCFNGHTSIRQEFEGEESEMFTALFEEGMEIVEGPGAEDGVRHVEPQEAVRPRMYRLRDTGKGLPHVRLVAPVHTSLSKTDVFVLVANAKVFVWWWRPSGPALALLVSGFVFAHELRSECKAFADNILTPLHPDFDEFWAVLGVQLPCDYENTELIVATAVSERENLRAKYKEVEDTGNEDDLADLPPEDGVDTLSHGILFTMRKRKDGKPELAQIKDDNAPLRRSMLQSEHSYILDCESEVFVWKGRKCGALERRLITKTARSLFEQYDRPPGSQFRLVAERGEPASLRMRAADWQPKPARVQHEHPADGAKAKSERRAAAAEAAREMAKTRVPEQVAEEKYYDIDYTKRDFSVTDVWMMVSLDPRFVKLAEEDKGVFYSEHCYMVLNRQWDDDYEMWVHNIYFWQGRDCNNMWYAACLLGFIPSLRKRLIAGGRCRRNEMRVFQQKEPPHFLNLFKNLIVINRGEFDDERPSKILYRLAMRNNDLRAVEIDPRGDLLDSKDSYVLQLPQVQYVWLGKQCPPIARVASLEAAWHLEGERSSVVFFEGVNTVDFWERLGGFKKSLYYGPAATHPRRPVPHMRVWKIGASGPAALVPQHDVCGLDLEAGTVQIVDMWFVVYVWPGRETTPSTLARALAITGEYVGLVAGQRNTAVSIELLEYGLEPFQFLRAFDMQTRPVWGRTRDPRAAFLKRHGRSEITGLMLKGVEVQERIHYDDDDEEEDEDEVDLEDDIPFPPHTVAAPLVGVKEWKRIRWEDVKLPDEPAELSDEARLQKPPLDADATASLVWEKRLVGSTVNFKAVAPRKPVVPVDGEEEDEEDDDDPSRWMPLPVFPKSAGLFLSGPTQPAQAPEAQQQQQGEQAQGQEEKEPEDEGASRMVNCDYCGDEGPWKSFRSTPLHKDRKIETNGICKNCWAKMAVGLAWPESRLAQKRAEAASASTEKAEQEPPPAEPKEKAEAKEKKSDKAKGDKDEKHHHKDKDKDQDSKTKEKSDRHSSKDKAKKEEDQGKSDKAEKEKKDKDKDKEKHKHRDKDKDKEKEAASEKKHKHLSRELKKTEEGSK